MTAIEEEELRAKLNVIQYHSRDKEEAISKVVAFMKAREAALTQQHEREIAEARTKGRISELAESFLDASETQWMDTITKKTVTVKDRKAELYRSLGDA